MSYKPATRTTYRTGVGEKYYRPSQRYQSNSGSYSYRPYQPPKSYRPPTYRGGHYYYPTHARSKPYYFGFWVFNHHPDFSRRSVYFHFGYFPYIQVTRVYETSYPEVVYVDRPIYVKDDYYLESQTYKALDEALSDVRSAWLSGRYDLIERHVMPNDKVAIFLDGRYDYSIDGEDYLHMTRDALQDLETVSFVWDNVRQRTDGTVTAFGTHRYFDASGNVKTVYVSYTLDKVGSEYYIVEIGSSLDPLY